MEGLNQLRYDKVAGMGYIGATPFVNYSVSNFMGLKNIFQMKKDESYEDAIKRENELHEKKMNRLTKAKSKRLELKRHIKALSDIDERYKRFEYSPLSKATKEKKEKDIVDHLDMVRKGVESNKTTKDDKALVIDRPMREKDLSSAEIPFVSDANIHKLPIGTVYKNEMGMIVKKGGEVKSSADGSFLDTLTTTAKALLPQPKEEVKPKLILGMPPAVFYSIVGLIALTVVVLIIKNKK